MTKARAKSSSGATSQVGLDVADFLITNATATGPATKKSTIPELTGRGALADKVAKAYKVSKDAETAFRLVESELLDVTGPEYERRSRAGEHTKTLNVPGVETGGVQVTYPDKFSALDVSQEKGLREQLGSEVFDTLFEQDRTLTLKDECTDNKTIKLLLDKLGPDLFKQIFDIKVVLASKDDMDRKQFTIPEPVRVLCGLKQSKASVKVVK